MLFYYRLRYDYRWRLFFLLLCIFGIWLFRSSLFSLFTMAGCCCCCMCLMYDVDVWYCASLRRDDILEFYFDESQKKTNEILHLPILYFVENCLNAEFFKCLNQFNLIKFEFLTIWRNICCLVFSQKINQLTASI